MGVVQPFEHPILRMFLRQSPEAISKSTTVQPEAAPVEPEPNVKA